MTSLLYAAFKVVSYIFQTFSLLIELPPVVNLLCLLHCIAVIIRVTEDRQYCPQGTQVGQPCFRVHQKSDMKPERGNLVRKDGLISKDTSLTR